MFIKINLKYFIITFMFMMSYVLTESIFGYTNSSVNEMDIPYIAINNVSPVSGTAQAPATVTINYTITQNGTNRIYLDGEIMPDVASGIGTFNYTFYNLSSGTHTLEVILIYNTQTYSDSRSYVVNAPQNLPPVASINSISPNPASYGSSVSFSGSGSDPDGSITGYSWRSSINGTLSSSSSFSTSSLSQGSHTIYFKVKDNAGVWSSEVSSSLTINPPPNSPPTASINSISPDPASYGSSVSFSGSGSDLDGSITAYSWRSSINGTLSSSSSFSTSSLSQGSHTIYFKVKDNAGVWSSEVSSSLTINPPPNSPPTASINSISPNPASYGSSVSFSGSGSDLDGSITAYSWRSSINGTLSSSSSFSTSSLSAGTHTIYFKVKDNGGAWSNEVSQSVTIKNQILGYVKNTSGQGLSGVSIYLQPYGILTTDVNGYYHYEQASPGVPIVVTPSKAYYSFSPSSYSTTSINPNHLVPDFIGTFVPVPPAATINSISPVTTVYGTTITFSGSGNDPDGGSIQAYSWRSNIDGQLSSSASFSTSSLSAGTHTIYFKVKDNEGTWSLEESQTVKIYSKIYGYVKNTLGQGISGVSVYIQPYGTMTTDANGYYHYDQASSGIPFVVTPSKLDYSFSPSNYSTATVNNSYLVPDFIGTFYSEPPTVDTVLISPDSVFCGTNISFIGSGSDPDGGTIQAYSWRSSIDGHLSSSASFNTSSLSAGTHNIYFKVEDDEGVWSTEVSRTVTIYRQIFGYVKDTNGQGINGVSVYIQPYGIVTTDTNGYYHYDNPSSGIPVVATPSKSNYSFSPINYSSAAIISCNLVVPDFVGTHFNSPIGSIVSITPNPAKQGIVIDFVGTWSHPDGGIVQTFSWRSSINGHLSDSLTFAADTLSAGTHLIYFKVKDNNNLWSAEDSLILTVTREKSISYQYDNLNNITQINADSNFIFNYQYDTEGRLYKVKTTGPNSAETTDAVYTYNNADQVINLQPGYLQPVTYTYDPNRGWLTNITHSAGKFSENLTYFDNGNIETQTIGNNTLGGNYTYTFGYDNQNRLTSANTALAGANESYTYNDDGSFLTKNRSGNNLEYKYWPNNNRLKDVIKNTTDTTHYAYDTKGNIYGGFGVLKEYNYQNLPAEMMNENSETYNYNYNGNGERVKKANTGTGEGEYYLRDFSGRELVIYDNETGEIKSANIFGNGLVGKLEVNGTTDTRSYYLKDHLGNIRTVLNPSGTVTNAMDYYPYGELLRSSGQNKYKFTEKERDTESGYDYFGARYYDNKLALWLQVDPMSDKYPGVSPYNYALYNPLRYIDPTGMEGEDNNDDEKKKKEEEEWLKKRDELYYRVTGQEKGQIAVLAMSGTMAAGAGANFEIGLAFNLTNGYAIAYARYGVSIGLSSSLSLESNYLPNSSLQEFIGDENFQLFDSQNAVELEALLGNIAFESPANLQKQGLLGGGFNIGLGFSGFSLNASNQNFRSPIVTSGALIATMAGIIGVKNADFVKAWLTTQKLKYSPIH